MRHIVTVLAAVAFSAMASLAGAETCRPPVPGTWSDARVEALFDSGQERLSAARGFEGEARHAAANQAEAMFREIETRVACLPSSVVALAESLALQGEYLEAAEQYRRVLAARSELEKYRFWRDSLAAAEVGLSAALSQISTVVVRLGEHGCAKGARKVLLDDKPIAFDAPLSVNPKTYLVRVDAPGCRPFSQHVVANPGESTTADVDLTKRSGPPMPPSPPPPPARCLGMPVWVCITAGGVVAVGAILGGAVALGQSEEPAPAPSPTFNCASTGATLGCTSLR